MNSIVQNAHVAMTLDPEQLGEFVTSFYALTKQRFEENFRSWNSGQSEAILYANLAVSHFCIVLETLNVRGQYNLGFNQLTNTNNTEITSQFQTGMNGRSNYFHRQAYLSNKYKNGQLISFVTSRYKKTYEQLKEYLNTTYLPFLVNKVDHELRGISNNNDKKIKIMELIMDHFRNNVNSAKIINNVQIYHGMYSLLCMYGLENHGFAGVHKLKHPGHCGVAALLSTYLLSRYGLYDTSIFISPTADKTTQLGARQNINFGSLHNPNVILSDITAKCVLSHYEIWAKLGNQIISSNNPARKNIPGGLSRNRLSYPQFRTFYGNKRNAFIIFTLQQVFRARARNSRRLAIHKIPGVQNILDNLVNDFTRGYADLANSARTVRNHTFNLEQNTLGRKLFDSVPNPRPGVIWQTKLVREDGQHVVVYEKNNGRAYYKNILSNGRYSQELPVTNKFRNQLRSKLHSLHRN